MSAELLAGGRLSTSHRVTIASALLTTLGVMPVFAVGALGPFVSDELGIDLAGSGVAVGAYFAMSAIASAPAGRIVEAIGSQRAGVIAGSISVLTLLAIGLSATSWAQLVVLLAVGGVGNAFAQLSSNLAMARGVVHDRQGLAYGIKRPQSCL